MFFITTVSSESEKYDKHFLLLSLVACHLSLAVLLFPAADRRHVGRRGPWRSGRIDGPDHPAAPGHVRGWAAVGHLGGPRAQAVVRMPRQAAAKPVLTAGQTHRRQHQDCPYGSHGNTVHDFRHQCHPVNPGLSISPRKSETQCGVRAATRMKKGGIALDTACRSAKSPGQGLEP